jgi:hypothetical protein
MTRAQVIGCLIEGCSIRSTVRMTGVVECGETYVGGKPRYSGISKRGRGADRKAPLFAAVERGGQIRRRVMAHVDGANLKQAMQEVIDPRATVITDEFAPYKRIGKHFSGGHRTIRHKLKQYVDGDIHTNTVESSHALVKRGIVGVYHNVSKEYLHRYLWHFDIVWNGRKMNDGERTVLAIESAEGKRLAYKAAPYRA